MEQGLRDKTRQVVDDKVECTRCNTWKYLDEYPKNKGSALGIYSYCSECSNEKGRENHKKYRAKGAPDWERKRRKYRNDYYRKTYGITADEFDIKLAEQDGCCEICNTELSIDEDPKKAHLDHNHRTGQIRGVLCVRCNKGIGFFLENEDYLGDAVKYLRKYKELDNEFSGV